MASVNPRHIVALLLMLSVAMGHRATAQQSETRIALVIGNASYPDAEAPLRDPVNNARALTDELRRSGFEVDVGENLTKEAMRAAFDRFNGKIKPGSTALFFFSGYGVQSDRQTFVIPVNAQIWTEADVRRDGYTRRALPSRSQFSTPREETPSSAASALSPAALRQPVCRRAPS